MKNELVAYIICSNQEEISNMIEGKLQKMGLHMKVSNINCTLD